MRCELTRVLLGAGGGFITQSGDVLLLENVRFHKEEEANDIEFAKKLASGIDFYVNDAFGTAHRAHASTAGIATYVSGRVAGFLLDKELSYLIAAIQNPPHPFVAIVSTWFLVPFSCCMMPDMQGKVLTQDLSLRLWRELCRSEAVRSRPKLQSSNH